MTSRIWMLVFAFSVASNATVLAQTVTIETDNLRTGVDDSRRRARDMRLNDEDERQQRAETLRWSSGQNVRVSLEIVCGALCSTTDRKLTVSGGPGTADRSPVPSEVIIRPSGGNGTLGGTYRYVATWKSKVCTGQITVSGTANYYYLRLYDTCGDAGSREGG